MWLQAAEEAAAAEKKAKKEAEAKKKAEEEAKEAKAMAEPIVYTSVKAEPERLFGNYETHKSRSETGRCFVPVRLSSRIPQSSPAHALPQRRRFRG